MFLVVGCFLDAIPAIIIVGAILEPLAKAANMDAVHFAMIGVVSPAFRLVTPPYGLCGASLGQRGPMRRASAPAAGTRG